MKTYVICPNDEIAKAVIAGWEKRSPGNVFAILDEMPSAARHRAERRFRGADDDGIAVVLVANAEALNGGYDFGDVHEVVDATAGLILLRDTWRVARSRVRMIGASA